MLIFTQPVIWYVAGTLLAIVAFLIYKILRGDIKIFWDHDSEPHDHINNEH